jgi:hypothetical protein
MMTPIDQYLSDQGLRWHRYVDDFTLSAGRMKMHTVRFPSCRTP